MILNLQNYLINNNNYKFPSNLDLCFDGKDHEYPSVWFGTIPPHCKKCNKQGQEFEITFNNSTGTVIDFNEFGGNIIYDNPSNIG